MYEGYIGVRIKLYTVEIKRVLDEVTSFAYIVCIYSIFELKFPSYLTRSVTCQPQVVRILVVILNCKPLIYRAGTNRSYESYVLTYNKVFALCYQVPLSYDKTNHLCLVLLKSPSITKT